MIDIHCHILHGIDDGSTSLEESVRLCSIAVENSISKAVVTPHLSKPEQIEEFTRLRDKRLDELRRELDKNKLDLELVPGAEVYVDDEIFFAPNLDTATLNGSRYMLIEFRFRNLNINRLIKYIGEIRSRGYIPIIAHPERYHFTQENYDIVNHLADIGVLFQLNAPSLAGFAGYEAQELAFAMAASGMASFIGTDAHSVYNRPNNLLALRERFPRQIDAQVYDRMLGKNTQTVLDDGELERGKLFPIRRKKFFV